LKGIHKQETLEEGEIGVFFLDGDAYVNIINPIPVFSLFL